MFLGYAGATEFANVFWTSYQIISVVRASEEVIEALRSTVTDGYSRAPPELRKYIVKKGKATRALYYRVGNFSDFSLDVPVGIWDEIINQLLFLLSF